MEPSLDTPPIAASLSVDRALCQSAAVCLAYAMYELDDEEKAVILTANGSNSDEPTNPLAQAGEVKIEDLKNTANLSLEKLRELALESAKACPFNAIIVKDNQGRIIWPPQD
jgi:ferredoxin